ncbi:MAG: FeoA domain-containing protein [Acidobacteria bacterium]|jgi:DtxR family Mn-dependent transcriptional regulator|nr:FeoA domain-containing protein [Acidobacteriota bacterium]
MPHRTEISEAQQELLEALWQHEEEARPMEWGRFTGSDKEELIRAGWLHEPDLILTQEGKVQAARAIRRHRLAERLLSDVLGVSDQAGEQDACRLEHSLVEGLAERVCTFLGHPRVCPHGHRIPEGPCCLERRSQLDAALAPLTRLQAGEEGVIAYLATGGEEDLDKFLSMGIHPGDRVALIRKSPTVVFRCGNAQFAVDRELAAGVYVRRR